MYIRYIYECRYLTIEVGIINCSILHDLEGHTICCASNDNKHQVNGKKCISIKRIKDKMQRLACVLKKACILKGLLVRRIT